MKAKTFVVAMIMPLVAMTFQSCPGQMIPVPETDMYAYVYNPDDSIYVRFYTHKDDQLQKHEMSIEPDKKVRPIQWYSGNLPYNNESYNSENNDLHIRKINQNAVVYVLRSSAVIVNGRQIAWDRLPTQYYVDAQSELPYLEQVIDTLLLHYPEKVVVIDDLQEHSIYNDRSYLDPPSIQLN